MCSGPKGGPDSPHTDSLVLKEFRAFLCPEARLLSSNPVAHARSSITTVSGDIVSAYFALYCVACRRAHVGFR